jgi:hypothetical protein
MSTRMLYKYPGEEQLQDDKWAIIIVPETEAEKYVKEEGWFYTSPDAKEAYLSAKVADKEKKVKSVKPAPVVEEKVEEEVEDEPAPVVEEKPKSPWVKK